MGDPKFARSKTQTPTHPWKQARIDEEHALKEKYGLKKVGGMKEIWREKSSLRRHRNQAMKLIGRVDTSEGHFAREKTDLVNSLCRQGLLVDGASIDDVLQINVEHMLSRRLQSVVYYRGLAPSMRAARNMIVHGHISIGEQKMTVPGYHIRKLEEEDLNYASNSVYNDPNHPFRVEMEKLRLTMVNDEEPEEVGGPKAATEDFVDQIKKDAEDAPKIEETIPKEGN
ncbi:30S ribosomal protein S4 [Euryarchaeota archaeon]|jgi:small subunit ribosomal protein S4|nr:30S ribosomal protein S4 [Candidatus Thalassarchaeum sp.]MCH1523674.1 30S ribosomal protein S4 [Candidatus Thalassarchaeaceae archaeon]MDA7555386.1 30S ribosomal protein S4 [Euryarchaeota archaeon]MDB3855645.1 30S ribosomal protein S4 [Euryarchaeota archaeon]MDB4864982.1 30S ribosomal protein S4 [Euryarchaeota archaeon]|tara:strand:- start:438 stop:1118 length:681 start_codon:yes stop_codon:yes gene_type:complete